ncbi:MAG: hypothetical protein WCK86_03380 [Planctomycetia bacterium]
MSLMQRWLSMILPKSLMAAIESESRSWKITCPCGDVRSVWECGGIRWKAYGQPTRWLACPKCRTAGWHTITQQPDNAGD